MRKLRPKVIIVTDSPSKFPHLRETLLSRGYTVENIGARAIFTRKVSGLVLDKWHDNALVIFDGSIGIGDIPDEIRMIYNKRGAHDPKELIDGRVMVFCTTFPQRKAVQAAGAVNIVVGNRMEAVTSRAVQLLETPAPRPHRPAPGT